MFATDMVGRRSLRDLVPPYEIPNGVAPHPLSPSPTPPLPMRKATLFSAAADVRRFFGNHLVHEDVVLRRRNLVEHLALERQRNQWRVRASVLEQLVVVALAVSGASSASVKRDAWDHDQIELVDGDV